MNADQVRAYVAAKWPDLMKSPLAQAFGQIAAQDEAERAVDFARLQAVATYGYNEPAGFDMCEDCEGEGEIEDYSEECEE